MIELGQQNRRLLVIDDNEAIHSDFRKVLCAEEPSETHAQLKAALFGKPAASKSTITYEIDSAYQGEEGLTKVTEAAAQGRPYALAFVDMRMPPGWDGVQTIERIWQVDPDVQVVVCTAYSDYSWDEIVRRLGRTDRLLLLKKPFDTSEVWQLACALTEKWNQTRLAQTKMSDLEQAVAERTRELQDANQRLQREMAERKQAEDAASRIGRILNVSLNEIYIFDTNSLRFLQVNHGAQVNIGYSMEELAQFTPLDIVPDFTREALDALLLPLRHGEQEKVLTITTHRRKDGSTYPVEIHVQLLPYESSQAFVAIGVDITERKKAEDLLRHNALHDALTGLPNRALLLDRLHCCLERGLRQPGYLCAVLFLDIDNFKLINDSLGHSAGDEILVQVAVRFQSSLRGLDAVSRLQADTAARIGGDEFVILLDGIASAHDAAQVADRLLGQLSEPFRVSGHDVTINASVGIALNDHENLDPHALLRNADVAMYRAKEAGKAQYAFFDLQMHNNSIIRLQLENELRRAVERREFILAYQPIIALQTRRIIGFEALVRWVRGTEHVAPDRFIHIAEETGLIVPIGRWVLEEACRQLKSWSALRPDDEPLSVNVNISRRQLLQPSLSAEIHEILDAAGVAPQRLHLEVTESIAMKDSGLIQKHLRELREIGAGLQMDDFGTGYSSLSCLHAFPLDVVKIDRAFLATMDTDWQYVDVVGAIITLIHCLNMKVTAEGVETENQLKKIASLGCDYAQGYLFAAPLDAEAATRLLLDWPHAARGVLAAT